MNREPFRIGEIVEVYCTHTDESGERVAGWLKGRVVAADFRMAGIAFETDVTGSDGRAVPDRILWCAHGSRRIRRPK